MNKPIDPVLPFIWPEPLVSAGFNTYVTELPFDVAVRSAVSVFGVVSAIDARAVNWMEGFLADRPETQLRLVVTTVRLNECPNCQTPLLTRLSELQSVVSI